MDRTKDNRNRMDILLAVLIILALIAILMYAIGDDWEI